MKNNLGKKENKRIITRIIKDARPIYGWLLLGALIALCSVALALYSPLAMGDITNLLYNRWKDNTPLTGLTHKLLILTAVYTGMFICSMATNFLMNRTVSRFYTCNLRIRLSDKIRKMPVKFVDDTPHGEVISRMMGDVSMMGTNVHNMFNVVIQGIFQLIGIVAMMFSVNTVMAALVVASLPLPLTFAAVTAKKSQKHFADLRREWGNLNAFLEQDYSGFESIKAFNLEAHQIEKHAEITKKVVSASIKGTTLSDIVQPILSFSNSFLYLVICVVGGYFVIKGTASAGDIIAIILYSKMLSSPLENIANGMGMMQRVSASAKRVYEILDKPEMSADAETTLNARGDTQFKDVCFSYEENKPLIENLNFSAQQGERIAIVGPTGGGKTTIINLIMRFYDIDRGTILIDETDTRDVNRGSLRKSFGMVLQDTWLFSGTIRENLAYGNPDATDAQIKEAARVTSIDNFIEILPEGYDTVINEESANISSGQKQLMTIARAYLSSPKMLILDEATSNVDTRTETHIQRAMNRLMAGKTSFVIAHRLSTIIDADLILVVNNGKIVEQGKHLELLAAKGFYYQLYNAQYNADIV